MFCKVSVPEWEGSDGAAGNPAHQNQSICEIRGESEVSGVLPVRGGQFLIHSLNLFHLCNQNDAVTGAQEWEQCRAAFLMARLARTSMTQFIHLQRGQIGGISL